MPEVKDAKCEYRREKETMRYILTECICFKEIRRIIWVRELRKASVNWINLEKIFTTPAYIKKSAIFMYKTDFLKQFWGLKSSNLI